MPFVPPSSFTLNASTVLRLIEESHAPALLQALTENRAHLPRWLPWVDNMQSEADFHSYIRRCKQEHEAGTDMGYVVFHEGRLAGRIGVHQISSANKSAAIGYWLAEGFTGKGIITSACTALIGYCFATLGLRRIEIKCAVGNGKSEAIPKRLGFTKEGVMRQAECVNGEMLDLNLYSLLNDEWETLQGTTPALVQGR